MNFYEVSVKTNSESVEIITALLSDIFSGGFRIEDKNDFNDFLNDTEIYWDYVDEELREKMENIETTVIFYPSETEQGEKTFLEAQKLLSELKDTGNYGSLEITRKLVCEEDWANNWKQYFKPFNIGERLLIKPSWETVEDDAERVVLEIDPKSSFGTGQHETTCLCLEVLDDIIKGDENVLDMGCGSGILSIAALLLGAKETLSIDIDENAVITTIENAEMNGVSKKITAVAGNSLEGELNKKVKSQKYDVICANIVADVIIAFLPLFKETLIKEGKLLLSGIIKERLKDIETTVNKHGFEILEIKEKNGWCAVILTI